jgi:ribosomal protein L40E
MLVFDCHVCRQKLSAQESQAGMLVRCSKCKATLTVPSAVPVAASAAASSTAGAAFGAPRLNVGIPGAAAAFRAAGSGGKRFSFNCGYCSSRLEATEAMSAQDGQCPTCGNTITIPIQDRYGRLIDPKTRQIIKQDPHPVHAYAAAGDRAPQIIRQNDGKQIIRCGRCSAASPITAHNCKACGMPFTMEGTTLDAAGGSNGFCVASLVLGIIGLAPCAPVGWLAVVFGIIGYNQAAKSVGSRGGKGLAIAGIVCGSIGTVGMLYFYHVL